MSKLPQSIDMQGPRGATARGTTLDFDGLDNALQGVAREVSRFDQTRKAVDDEEAERIVATAEASYSAGAVERWAAYDGRTLGQDAAEVARFDQETLPLLANPNLPDGVRDSLTRKLRDTRVRVMGRAATTAAQTRAQRYSADRDAANQSEANRLYDTLMVDWSERSRAIQDQWDGGDLVSPLTAAFDEVSAPLLDGQPPEVVERLRGRIEGERTRVVMNALQGQDQARGAIIARNATQSANALVNRIAANPATLEEFDQEIAPILATLPATARQPFADRTWQMASSRALEVRIEAGDFESVKAEIAAGTWDRLDADTVAGLGRAIESADAVKTIEDARAEQDLAAEIDAGVREILNGGAPDPGLVARALEIGGPDLAAKVETDQKAAASIRPLMGRLRTLTPQAAQQELEQYAAAAGDATGARVLELATELITRDRELRSDPAAWAATPIGPGDRVAEDVQGRYRAFLAQPSPEAAAAYARATWNAQAAGGVPLQARRVLDTATAESWIAELDADGAPATALAALGQRAALFGDGYRPQVLRELGLAGLKPADLGALTHYVGSPRRMDLYVRGRALRPNDAVPERDRREEIDSSLNTALEPYMRAVGSRRGGPATVEAARVMAYGLVSRGESVRDAVRTATAPMVDAYEFNDTYAVPTRANVDAGVIRHHASRVVQSLTANDGRGAYAPPTTRYTPDQSRRIYADQVRETATWRNLADDTGVELVMPNARGEAIRVRDAAGRDVVRTWAELERLKKPD